MPLHCRSGNFSKKSQSLSNHRSSGHSDLWRRLQCKTTPNFRHPTLDDVLISLSHHESSILELLSFLKSFALVSGYKIDIQKTQLLSFNYKPSQNITSNIQLNWNQEYIKYLGVNIPKELSNKLNFRKLNQKLKLRYEEMEPYSMIKF